MSESRRALRDVGTAATATAAGAGATWAAYNVLTWQAQKARTVIPHRTDNAPNGDGLYLPDGRGPVRVSRGDRADLHLTVFGDSTAAGLGVDSAEDTPGVRVTRRVVAETGRSIRFSNKAIVGATSKGLAAQIDAMLIAGERPDVAVIRTAAATKHVDMREPAEQIAILLPKLFRIAHIQLRRVIKFFMAAPG